MSKKKDKKMPEATPDQIQRILVLWLLFSSGNRVDLDTWNSQILPKIAGPGKLPPGVTPKDMLDSAVQHIASIANGIGGFKAYTDPASFAWGGGTSCPKIETILAMFP